MNINNIEESLEYINQIGQTLNIEEITKLRIGISKIILNYNFDNILFWGRINGIKNDYYICLGLKFQDEYEFPKKSFFYSTNEFEFLPLPNIIPEYENFINDYNNKMFEGNPETILFQKEVDEEEVEIEENEEETKEQKLQKELKNLEMSENEFDNKKIQKPILIKEINKLSYIIRAIEENCAIIPLNSLKIIPNHELRFNENFKGLNLEESLNKSNWMHFRIPNQEDKKLIIKNEESIFVNDFLDDLSKTRPTQNFNIQNNFSNEFVTVKNLIWQGFLAYHKLNSNIFGYCYFGNGLKCDKLMFII